MSIRNSQWSIIFKAGMYMEFVSADPSSRKAPPDLSKVFSNNIHPKKSKTSNFGDFKGRILKLILDNL